MTTAPTLPGWAHAMRGDDAGALDELRRGVASHPDLTAAWTLLGDLLLLAADYRGADTAYAQAMRTGLRNPALGDAAAALTDGRAVRAEHILKLHLRSSPHDAEALWLLGEAAIRVGRPAEAEAALLQSVAMAPDLLPARRGLAVLLHLQNRDCEAVPHWSALHMADPQNPALRRLLAAALARAGDEAVALALYGDILREAPGQPKIWLLYAHTLRNGGRGGEAMQAYRTCIGLAPAMAEAWIGLVNMKTARLSAGETAKLRAQLQRADLPDGDKSQFLYALGAVLERARDYAEAFTCFAEAARTRRGLLRYDPGVMSARVTQSRAVFSAGFFAAGAGWGCPSRAPIFIVGLPRSGSTLVEQILASHTDIEGTAELPIIGDIAGGLGPKYPALIATLDQAEIARLGKHYLSRVSIRRRLGRLHFIDKMPNNFLHIGLIHLMLPHAKIIDVRRAPLAAGFAVFKQHFARGHHFSYDLADIGRYYRDYVALMDHFDQVIPGVVHHVSYEDLVANTALEIRRLLDYCGVDFQPACLAFWKTARPIRTASSEQVRQPVYRTALDQWRHYETWLGPLEKALKSG